MITVCQRCGRALRTDARRCGKCKGRAVELEHFDRVEFGKRRAQCFRCKHYGKHAGRCGCDLLPNPCDVEGRWTARRVDWCVLSEVERQPEQERQQTERDETD